MRISFSDFDMDESIVAPIIYGDNRHSTTNRGVVISGETRQELKKFLFGFNASVGIEQTPYYRIDAYFDEQTLWLLEINASFVDGWGTALNLARASGIMVDPSPLVFPKWFTSKSRLYLPELQLFVSELGEVGGIGRTAPCLLCETANEHSHHLVLLEHLVCYLEPFDSSNGFRRCRCAKLKAFLESEGTA
jgi:hypothetical protein